jgi:hypothetical protein
MRTIVAGIVAAAVIAVIVGLATGPASQTTTARFATENVRL